jgi:hypothetical protein
MDKLVKILNLIVSYETDDYGLGWKVFDVVKENPNSVVSFNVPDSWRRYNIQNEEHWVTYQHARLLRFYLKDNELYVDVSVADTGLMGYDYELIWTSTIKLPTEFLKNIETELRNKFYHFCEDAYEEYLLAKKEEWIRHFSESFLAR